jgi:hypothetical protein
LQRSQNYSTLLQITKRQFSDREGVRRDLTAIKQVGDCFIGGPQMFDPDRREFGFAATQTRQPASFDTRIIPLSLVFRVRQRSQPDSIYNGAG